MKKGERVAQTGSVKIPLRRLDYDFKPDMYMLLFGEIPLIIGEDQGDVFPQRLS